MRKLEWENYTDIRNGNYDEFVFVKNFGDEKQYSLNDGKHRLYYELAEFSEQYKNEDYDKFYEYNEKSLIVMKILEMASKGIGLEKKENSTLK